MRKGYTVLLAACLAIAALQGCTHSTGSPEKRLEGVVKTQPETESSDKQCRTQFRLVDTHADARDYRRALTKVQEIDCPVWKDKGYRSIARSLRRYATEARKEQQFAAARDLLEKARRVAEHIRDPEMQLSVFRAIERAAELVERDMRRS